MRILGALKSVFTNKTGQSRKPPGEPADSTARVLRGDDRLPERSSHRSSPPRELWRRDREVSNTVYLPIAVSVLGIPL